MHTRLDAFQTAGSLPPSHEPETDFTVSDRGSIFLLAPLTPAAYAWCDDHIPDDAQWLAGAVAVEHRYIRDIVVGAQRDGLRVRG